MIPSEIARQNLPPIGIQIMKNKVRLNVCGTDYYIASEDDESYIRAIGDDVDARMNKMMAGSDRVSTTMAAVLCALSYADECKKANATADSKSAAAIAPMNRMPPIVGIFCFFMCQVGPSSRIFCPNLSFRRKRITVGPSAAETAKANANAMIASVIAFLSFPVFEESGEHALDMRAVASLE